VSKAIIVLPPPLRFLGLKTTLKLLSALWSSVVNH